MMLIYPHAAFHAFHTKHIIDQTFCLPFSISFRLCRRCAYECICPHLILMSNNAIYYPWVLICTQWYKFQDYMYQSMIIFCNIFAFSVIKSYFVIFLVWVISVRINDDYFLFFFFIISNHNRGCGTEKCNTDIRYSHGEIGSKQRSLKNRLSNHVEGERKRKSKRGRHENDYMFGAHSWSSLQWSTACIRGWHAFA